MSQQIILIFCCIEMFLCKLFPYAIFLILNCKKLTKSTNALEILSCSSVLMNINKCTRCTLLFLPIRHKSNYVITVIRKFALNEAVGIIFFQSYLLFIHFYLIVF